MVVHFVKKMSSNLNIGKRERRKERKTVNFLSIFVLFDSTKSVEDSCLLCIWANVWIYCIGFGKPLDGEVKITTPSDPPTPAQEISSAKAFDLLGKDIIYFDPLRRACFINKELPL